MPPKHRTSRKRKLDTKIIHSLDKGLEVLELVGTLGDASLADLAQHLHFDKATIFRLLTTLIRRRYVQQDAETKRYRLGFRVLHLESLLFKRLDLPGLSREVLTALANDSGEAAHLAVLQKDQVMVIAQRESPERVAANAHVGSVEPLHSTALGKAVLMQLSDEALRRTVASLDLTPYTRNTIVNPEWLIKHLQKARELGYAVDEEEFDAEVRCIAAPVHIPGSRQLFAIGISGPSSRVSSGRMGHLIQRVQQASQALERLFSGEMAGS
ncbi:MAG: IclR family transcriptional regulator [Acidobacteria bacterium]|nr:IclR family transcriptional regulator [Acidobacteriota bacterium]